MATEKVAGKKAAPKPTKAKKRPRPPYLRARQRGTYTAMMEECEKAFKAKNPDREIYWAADPEHDKKFSKVPKRQMMGYELVDAQTDEIKQVMGEIGSQVRIGDLVMMSIPRDWRDEIAADKAAVALEDSRRSRDAYERDVGRDLDDNVARPVGRITDHEEEIAFRKKDD